MPCWDANGLLPGRGPAGRCPIPCWDANGLLPGREPPGRGGCERPSEGRGAGRDGVAGAAVGVAAGEAAAAGAGTEVSGVGAGALGAAGAAADAAGEEVAGPGRGAAEGRAGPGTAAARAGAAAVPSATSASRSLRATGGSMVDEGLLTNSPSSFSFASATLLSTPSSEAISCTRGFATASPVWGLTPNRADRYRRTGLISSRSLRVHSRSAVSRWSACPGLPTRAMPARTPSGAPQRLRTPVWDEATRPAREASRGGRSRGFPRGRRTGPGPNGVHGHDIPRTFVRVPCYTRAGARPPVSPPARSRAGCRSWPPSAWRPGARSDPPCRSRATIDSRGREPGRPSTWRRARSWR